jgi:hypothetical protein
MTWQCKQYQLFILIKFLLSSVTSFTSRLLCLAWMADVEGSSDFFFRCDLKSNSPLTVSFSALSLAELGPSGGVTSFLKLAELCPPGGVTSFLRLAELCPPGGVTSFLRLAGIPLASQWILIVFSGSDPNAATGCLRLSVKN